MTRAHSLLAAPFVCLAMTATLLAQSNPLEVIPDDAYGFAVIHDLSDANARVGKLTAKMQLPVPDLLEMVKGMAGVDQGLDEKGGLAIAVLPTGDKGIADLGWFGFAPVSDYKQFIGTLSPQDADAAITKVTVFGQSMLVGRKGDFAVFAVNPQHKALLEKVLSSKTSVISTVEPLKSWIGEQQLAVVVTPSGKTKLFQSLAAAMPTQKQIEAGLKPGTDDDEDADKDQKGDAEEDDSDDKDDEVDAEVTAEANALAGVGQMFGMFKELLIAADEQLTHLAAGVRIEDTATLHVAVRALFVPDGKLASWAKNIKVPSEGLLAGVPPGDYVFAYGGVSAQFSPEVWALISRFSANGMQMMGLDKERRKAYMALSEQLQAGKVYSGGVMGMMRPAIRSSRPRSALNT